MWTNQDWSQRRLDKAALEKELNDLDMTVLGWCNRKPDVVRDDGEPVDWREVEKIAWSLFLAPPESDPAPVKEEGPKPEPKAEPKRSRKRNTKKK